MADDRYDHMTVAETVALWSEYHGVDFSHEAGRDLVSLLMRSPEAMWRAEYAAERAARLDAEARLRGLLATMGLALAALTVICALAGCLRATTEASRAAARWEVSDG